MIIDNSQMVAFETCGLLYFEKYVKGIEFDWEKKGVNAAHFGTRMHELLEEHYLELKGTPREPYPEHRDEPTELEAQLTMAAYRNHHPLESFTVLDVEKTFRVPLGPQVRCKQCGQCYDVGGVGKCQICNHPNFEPRHEYCGKFDIILRDNETGMLSILDHKTESRRSWRNNPKAWAARSQATLYLWAAPQIYGEEFRDLIVNVLRRQSDKGQIGPEFPERQRIQRNAEQMELAVRDLIVIADRIEEYKTRFADAPWPADRNNCMEGNFECSYYLPHLYGWSDDVLRLYRPTKPYLDL